MKRSKLFSKSVPELPSPHPLPEGGGKFNVEGEGDENRFEFIERSTKNTSQYWSKMIYPFLFSFVIFGCFSPVVISAGDFIYQSEGKRDPFLPAGMAVKEGAKLGMTNIHIEGVIIDPKKNGSYALINGEPRRIGEEFDGVRIKDIKKDVIVFIKDNGEMFEMVINQEEEMLKEMLAKQSTKAKKISNKEPVPKAENKKEKKVSGLEGLAEMTRQKVLNDGKEAK